MNAAFFGLDGTPDNLALFNSLQFHLQKPVQMSAYSLVIQPWQPIQCCSPQVIDQYNQFYIQYTNMYRAYEIEIYQGNTNAGSAFVGPGTGGYYTYAERAERPARTRRSIHRPSIEPSGGAKRDRSYL